MSDQVFMNILTALLLVYLVVYFFYEKLNKRLPHSAFVGFKNINEIINIFKRSLLIIKSNKWLLWFPLVFIAAKLLTVLPTFIYYRIKHAESFSFIAKVAPPTMAISAAAIKSLATIFNAPQSLDYGFTNAITGNFLFLIFFIFCLIGYKPICKKLANYLNNEREKEINFLKNILKFSLLLVSPFVVLLIFNIKLKNTVVLMSASVITLIILDFSFLAILAIIEGVILLGLSKIFEKRNFTIKELLVESLSVFKNLFIFNVLFVLITIVPSLLEFPKTLQAFTGEYMSLPYQLFEKISQGGSYFASLISIIIFLMPFIIVSEKLGVIDALKKTTNFIKTFLLKYIILIVISIILSAIPSYIMTFSNLAFGIGSFLTKGTVPYQLLISITALLRLFISVVVYVAIFNFYCKSKASINTQ